MVSEKLASSAHDNEDKVARKPRYRVQRHNIFRQEGAAPVKVHSYEGGRDLIRSNLPRCLLRRGFTLKDAG